jgi:multidrug efflux pump subunit AcrB
MSAFFRFFTERHTLAYLFTIMVILLGLGSLLRLKRDTFPEVDFGQVVITTRYPGASPEDVELNVTNELEDAIKGISNIERFTSYSMEDLSIISITINLQAEDIDEVRDDIREAINRVTDLPEEVTDAPLIVDVKSQELPVIEVGVAGDVPYSELRSVARQFKRKLEAISGVARVEEYWNLDREIHIEVSPEAIERYQIPLQDIANAVRGRNIRSTGGSFESYKSKKGLVTMAQFEDPNEVEDVIVRATFDGPVVRVRDLAEVRDRYEEPRIITRMNGVPAITFQIIKDSEADIIRTVDAVKGLSREQSAFLPEGVKILYANDFSYYVRNRFSVVLSNGAIGLLLVIITLAVFLNVRTAFWVALSIPVILLGVVFLLPFAGAHLDVIGLTAMILVIGIIVDDGIIVSENIVRQRELGASPLDAATEGIRGVFKPVFATLVTTFLAFAPMFFMTGVFGEFVHIIPLVITCAVMVSVFEVVIALPAHLRSHLHRIKVGPDRKRGWFDSIRDHFRRYFILVLKMRYLFLGFSVLLLLGSIFYAVRFMDFVLFPSSAADTFSVFIELPLGSSREATLDKTRDIEAIIAELPDRELKAFTTKIGTHGEEKPGEFEHWAFIRVNLTPFSKRGVTADEIVERLRISTDKLEGFEKIVFSVDAGGPPVGAPVTIRIISPDDDQRRKLTDSVVAKLESIDGVKDIDRNDTLGKPEVRIDLDYDKLPRLGLSVADVAQTVRVAFDGEVVTRVRYADEDVEFRVILEERARSELASLRRIMVENRTGRLVPLSTFARFSEGPGPSNIPHFDGLRTTTVTSDLDKEKIAPIDVTTDVVESFDLNRNWPGARFVVGGEAEETAKSFQSLGIALIIAVIGMFFVLILLFDSVTQPLMVMVAIPFGIIAVIITFALHGQPLGFLAGMGLIGLTGVVVNDSLVMVSHINELRKERPEERSRDIVAEGAANRLRAIVMTTITTVVGLIPLAYGIGGSDPFIAPMALALGYGLLFATPLTLVMIPCLYLVREDILKFTRWLFRSRVATHPEG